MSTKYPLEALLRPPVEFIPAAASVATAVALAAWPKLFMMTPSIGYTATACFLTHAAWRASQGAKIVRYHRNLKRLPKYVLTADEIPWSRDYLFLGLGFDWDQRHTQRLHDVRLPRNTKYHKPGAAYRWAREFEIASEHSGSSLMQTLRTLTQTDSPWNPVAPLPDVGGDPAIHGVEPDERPMWMKLVDRVAHMIVLGTTRVGKTSLAELLITQDIRRGDVVICFDPKGGAGLLRRMYAEAKRAGRESEFYCFHLGFPEISARYNPVGSFSRVTEVATRIANQLPGEGQSAAFREFVWRFVNVMSRALVALGRKPDYEQITRYGTDIEPLLVDYFEYWLAKLEVEKKAIGWRDHVKHIEAQLTADSSKNRAPKNMAGRGQYAQALMQYAKDNGLFDPTANALAMTMSYEKSYFDKLVASLLPLMEKLTTGKVAELISPDYTDLNDPRPIFSWQDVIARGGIVYVGLDALTDAEVAGAVGNSMFADLTSVAGQLYKRGQSFGLPVQGKDRKISVHADEFNELIGDEFIPLLNKAGGAGFQVTAYTQTWQDVEARIGSPAKAGQISGNFNTMIMLRVKNVETAEMLTNQLPDVRLIDKVMDTVATDTADPRGFDDFTSRNQDRITPLPPTPMLAPADLVQLPKGQAFALIEGGQLKKIRLPLADSSNDPMMPADLQAIAGEMERRYQSSAPGEKWANLWWTDQYWVPQPHEEAA